MKTLFKLTLPLLVVVIITTGCLSSCGDEKLVEAQRIESSQDSVVYPAHVQEAIAIIEQSGILDSNATQTSVDLPNGGIAMREGGGGYCDSCWNNFVVTLMPYGDVNCKCMSAYMQFDTGAVVPQIVQMFDSGMYISGATGFGKMCIGSHITLCINKQNCLEDHCFAGLIMVKANSTPWYFYDLCIDSSYPEPCFDLGYTTCCMPGFNNYCNWVQNTSWNSGYSACEECPTTRCP